MLYVLKQLVPKVSRPLLSAAILLLAGCFNDIQGPSNSFIWVSKSIALEQYRGDNGLLQHSQWQTGILDMAFDADTGLTWVIQKNGDLSAYNADAVRINYLHIDFGQGDKQVLLRAHKNAVWLAQGKLLTLISGQIPQWQREIPKGDILAIDLDRSANRLWLLTNKSIFGYDNNGNQYRKIDLPKKTENIANTLAYNSVHSRIVIAADKDLLAYGTNGTLIKRVEFKNVEQLVADIAGNLWASNAKKLYKLNPLSMAVVSSDESEKKISQLRRDPFNAGIWVLAEDGVSWVDGNANYHGGFFVGFVAKGFEVAYRLQTGGRPELTILQPTQQAVVEPNPEFILRATDAGGIVLNSFRFTVNTIAAGSSCSPDTTPSQYRCSLQSSLHQIVQAADARYRIEITVSNTAGNVSLPAAVTVLLDRDRDGVYDALDLCPNTPTGAVVDANGCAPSQLDSDHDGVNDAADLCPNTPVPEAVDANGCSASQRDSDHDGVKDNLDLCPATPAGQSVDAHGCSPSQLDTDNDGITDDLDQCPGTPLGEPANANGCSASQRDTDNDGVKDNLDQCPAT
ncbi:MAG TPA: thrombospondin type 3 repeat-containing protein, partial [Gammaproteobacteria bacterium]